MPNSLNIVHNYLDDKRRVFLGMILIDTITVRHQSNKHLIEYFVGDLSKLTENEKVDVLIVSAYPDDYTSTSTSLIGSLAHINVSVKELATDKEVDLRKFSSCWLSKLIDRPNVHFKRLLCFEPRHRGIASEVVGDIFRSIVPFTTSNPPISKLAIPLVASGDQGESPLVMLSALVEASVHWLSVGLPIDCIKIVINPSTDCESLREKFAELKMKYNDTTSETQHSIFRYDFFVSYSQRNKEDIDQLVDELKNSKPSVRIFMDRLELQPGAAWQQHIFDALDESRKIICVLSPEYLASKVCKEEFNIALFRHRESLGRVLIPIYLYSAELPTYMKMIQYEDVREGDRSKFPQLIGKL